MFDKVKYKFFSDKLNPFLYRVIPPTILIIFVLLIW